MLVHMVFDLLAWSLAAVLGSWIGTKNWLIASPKRTPFTEPYYFIALGLGAILGAVLFGSANLQFAGIFALGHSIAGALFGGIVSVEVYKWVNHLRGTTGLAFVAPLAAGIAIGRIGCFLAGLPDYTYGTPTTLPWGVDFGDGIARHPVQLYESAAMLAFLVLYLRGLAHRSAFVMCDGFYVFVLWYGVQRFAWEFLKPYPALVGPFNLFHILCAAMIAYALVMIGRNREFRQTV
jgi:prolipoprotein diacylglyceryltransferase